MAFAAGTDIVLVVDRRDLAGLCTDDDAAPVNPATVETNAKVLDALEGASEIIVSAAVIANKYRREDLQDLADSGNAFIKRLTCWIAHGELLGGRGIQREQIPPYVKRAESWVDDLRDGKRIFDLEANRDKGNVQTGKASLLTLQDDGIAMSYAQGRFLPAPMTDRGRRRDRW